MTMTAFSGHPPRAGRVAVVMGTRPEIIKLAPVVRALGDRVDVVFTAQHYDPELSDVFFATCGVPAPATVVPGVGGRSRSEQLVTMLRELTAWFEATRPAAVVVQGDTNTASAGAQAAHYAGIPVVHVEAGLRSWDRGMPEEINRLVIGAVADVHCCATAANAGNLLRGGAPADSVHVTGNTIVEATRAALPSPTRRAATLAAAGLVTGKFVVATVHRPENTDDPVRLQALLDALGDLGEQGLPVTLPLHPRTRDRIERFGCRVPAAVRLAPPADYATFLTLAAEAALLVSDSGGVQEEVTVLGKPLVVVRNSTERPESVEAGFSLLTAASGVRAAAEQLLQPGVRERLATTPSPFGDGLASRRIAALALEAANAQLRTLAS